MLSEPILIMFYPRTQPWTISRTRELIYAYILSSQPFRLKTGIRQICVAAKHDMRQHLPCYAIMVELLYIIKFYIVLYLTDHEYN